MNAPVSSLLAGNPWVTRRPLTVAEYRRMGEAGIFGERDRVELIEGQLIAMTPISSDHSGTVNALNYVLMRAVGDRAVVSPQHPVELDGFNEPQPDFALLRPRPDFYRERHPLPEDVLLLIEVAYTSVRYDRSLKMPLYARHGIPEYWIVRLDTRVVEVYRAPGPEGYNDVRQVGPDGALGVALLSGVTIPASAVLG